jgi:succinate-acetate transporter protein
VSANGVHPQVRLVVKPYASALPLGFFAFGIGMFLYAAQGAPWVPAEQTKDIGLLLVSFVFPLELIATVIAFLARDTAAAATLGLFTTSWLSGGVVFYTGEPGQTSSAFGYYLVAFTIVVVLLAFAAVAGKPLIALILTFSALRTVLAASYELSGNETAAHVGGWLAVAIFALACYGGLAFMLEDALGKEVLPVFRTGSAREAVEGDLSAQLERIESEAGVRQAL